MLYTLGEKMVRISSAFHRNDEGGDTVHRGAFAQHVYKPASDFQN